MLLAGCGLWVVGRSMLDVGCSMLDVRCWTFDVPPGGAVRRGMVSRRAPLRDRHGLRRGPLRVQSPPPRDARDHAAASGRRLLLRGLETDSLGVGPEGPLLPESQSE